MYQEVMTSPGVIEYREIEMPELQQGQVLIKVMRMGICGSDIHVYHGKHPYTKYPVTQGHEISGIIEEIGPGVTGLSIGQKVTVEPQVFCGKCYPCTHGKYNLCENLKVMGFQTTGMASEYFAVDSSKIVVLPNDMSLDFGAMIEPTAVAVHAAKRFDKINGSKVAVIGAGPIGILVAQAVKAFGAKYVLVTDISNYRLNIAKQCGADYAYNTKDNNFGSVINQCFGNDKADVIFDCAGNDITMGQAIKYARKGSTIILVAVYASIANVDLAMLNDHELDLNTTMMYRHEDYIDAISFVNKGKIKLEPLISNHFNFFNFKEAYEYIDSNRETTMKVIMDIGK